MQEIKPFLQLPIWPTVIRVRALFKSTTFTIFIIYQFEQLMYVVKKNNVTNVVCLGLLCLLLLVQNKFFRILIYSQFQIFVSKNLYISLHVHISHRSHFILKLIRVILLYHVPLIWKLDV